MVITLQQGMLPATLVSTSSGESSPSSQFFSSCPVHGSRSHASALGAALAADFRTEMHNSATGRLLGAFA